MENNDKNLFDVNKYLKTGDGSVEAAAEDNEEFDAEQQLNSIYDIGRRLYSQMGTDSTVGHIAVFTYLTELGRTLVGADRASFWKWDKEKHELWTLSATGVDKIVIPDDKGLVGKALKEERVIITNEPYSDPDFNSDIDRQTGYLTMSVLVMPVADLSGEYIGAFQIINKMGAEGFNEEEDTKKLSLAAFVCGIALESETFYEYSHIDSLTSLKNRLGFYSDLDHKYSEFIDTAAGKPVSLFLCDIDRYKKFNDNYGHTVGDDGIVYVADILRKHLRDGDSVYRWGGDEFVMVLPDTDLEGCKQIAEEVKADLNESRFKASGIPVKITLSFGCIQYDVRKSVKDNMAVADDYLFTAKDDGRNRVFGE